RGKKIFIDPATASFAVFSSLQADNKIVEGISPVALMKAKKNPAELSGFRIAMKKDGVALISFLAWLKEHIGKDRMTEYIVGRKLAEFRSEQDDFVGESFAP